MLLADVLETSKQVASTRSRLRKTGHLAELLGRLPDDESGIVVAFLMGVLPQGSIGMGPAALREAMPAGAADRPKLTLARANQILDRIAESQGPGSAGEKRRLLAELLGEATREEQGLLSRLLLGELRQGALEGLMVDAVARARAIPREEVQRALMLAGDTIRVAQAALKDGSEGLRQFRIQLMHPLRPMLAQPAENLAEALRELGVAALEVKLDGARVQAHKSGDEVRVFTRQLNDVTVSVPEMVEAVRGLPVREIILDGEVLALRPDGRPHPFQVTMQRFGRKLDVARLSASLSLSAFFFDCLYLDGQALIDLSAQDRFAALAGSVAESSLVPRLVTGRADEAASFLRQALEKGHEGVMAKALDAAYAAGSRGGSWLKLKPSHTLDLVVLAAEWGSGRRRGWLSNLHLGARDPAGGGFVMLGKTFKGMTDAMLAWQTRRLLDLELTRDGHTIYLRPELVVEVAFNEVQASPQYPAGLALRLARLKRYRPDKLPQQADTIETVRAIHEGKLTGRRTALPEA